MKRNVGNRERYARIGVGILSGVGAIFLPASNAVRVLLGVIGLGGLGTGASRYCPVNQALGIDNYGRRPEGGQELEEIHPKFRRAA